MTWELDGRPVRSVLVTRLRYLGDIVMSTVLIDVLRAGDADLRLGFLCEKEYAPVLEGRGEIDRIHSLGINRSGSDAKVRSTGGDRTSSSRSTMGTLRDLRASSYDLAVDLFFNPRSAWLLKLAGIPRRIGGTRKWRGRLYTHRVLRGDVTPDHPEFDRIAPGGLGEHLCRLAPLTHGESGRPFLDWLPGRFGPGELKPRLAARSESPLARESLGRIGIRPGISYLALAPGATWPSKEWPLRRWAEFLPLLLARTNLSLAVLTAPGGQGKWKELAALIPPGRGGVLPVLPLPAALAVIGSARALVTVDGGIMHAAVGLGVPTLALLGPTDPDIWFPYAVCGPFRVRALRPPCHPCDLHECPAFVCLPELEPGLILEDLALLLAESDTPGGGIS